MTYTYDKPTELGGSYTWKSKVHGNGSQTFTEMILNNKISTSLKFDDFEGVSTSDIIHKPLAEGGSEVNWTMKSDRPAPFIMRGAMFAMNMKKMIENSFTVSLKQLDALAANSPTTAKDSTIKK